MTESIREQLAEYAHEAWSGWMRYLFEKTIEVGDGCEEIQREQVERWKRQMNTPYSELPENEKESDRQEADKMLAILKAEKCDSTYQEAFTAGFKRGTQENCHRD